MEENKQIGFSFKVLLVDVIFRDGHIIVLLSALLGKLPFVTHTGCVCLFFLQMNTLHRSKYQQNTVCKMANSLEISANISILYRNNL